MRSLIRFFIKYKKRILEAVIVAVGVVVVGFFLYASGDVGNILSMFKPVKHINGIILFYGNNCSHCQKVDDFIAANHVDAKVQFTELEVFSNPENAGLLADKAQTCDLNTQDIGVPLLWDGTHCIIGDVDVIAFFKNKISGKKL
jgi:hypothetical protein